MPKPITPSPGEKNFVDQNLTYLRGYYDEQFKMIHQLRRLRFMRLKAKAPQAFQRIVAKGLHSPLSYRLVQTVTGLICKERPRFERQPVDKTDRDAASRLQQAADPLLQTYEHCARQPLFWMMGDSLVGDGRCFPKIERHVWAGYPTKLSDQTDEQYNNTVAQFIASGSNQPLRMRLVDPLNMLIPPEQYEPSFMIEQGKRPLVSTLRALNMQMDAHKNIVPLPEGRPFPLLELPAGINPAVDVEELWTPEFVFVRVGGQLLKFENDLHLIPYVDIYGEVSANMDPAVHSLSILYPFQGIEPWLNTLLGTLAAWSVIGAVPIMYTSRTPGAGGAAGDTPANVQEIPLGKRIDLGVGGQAGFLQPPPVGREVLEFIQLLVTFLDRAGITPLASGIMGTRTPGTAFDAAMEMAMSKLTPLVSNLERGLADIVAMSWKITEDVVKQPIWVTGMGLQKGRMGIGRRMRQGRYVIDPKDIHGYYDVKATLTTQSLQSLISKGMHAAFMRAHNLWTRDRAMRFSGVDDPWDEYLGTLRDRLEESPEIVQHIMQQALQEEPELAKISAELGAQGVDIQGLVASLGGAPGAVPGNLPGGAPAGIAGGGGTFGGAPQPRGQPAPGAGGRSRGSPRRPGGTRAGTPQGGMFQK